MNGQFLPRDNSAVLKSTSTRAREGWTIISRSSVAKTLSEQRTYTTYNISEARPNRCSRKKVRLILLLTFIVTTHGTDQDLNLEVLK